MTDIPPTHRALPIALFDEIRKFVGQLPHDQVHGLAQALDSAVPAVIHVPEGPAQPEEPAQPEAPAQSEAKAVTPPARPARTKRPLRK